MSDAFFCERCGQEVPTDQPPGSIVRCGACGKRLAVPASGQRDARRVAVQCAEPPPQDVGVLHEFAPHDELPEGLATKAMPWVISLFFHVGLMLIMAMFTLFVARDDAQPEKIVMGDIFPQDRTVPIMLVREPFRTNTTPALPSAPNRGLDDPLPPLRGLSLDKPDMKVIGKGLTSAPPGPGSLKGIGLSTSKTFFDDSDGRRDKPPTTTARNLVFVIDRSGSMIDTFDALRVELLMKIGYLTPEHRFCVVFFSDGRLLETPPGGLVRATEGNKLAAAAFLADIRPEGQTDAAPALERAFSLLERADARRGNMIFLLTDGVFPDNRKVLDLIARRNRRKEVMINTYLYGYRSPVAMEVLQKIARDSGSLFRYVDPADVAGAR